MPSLSFSAPDPTKPEAPKPLTVLWLVEGIFDAIALAHHGVAAVALMSCSNYPAQALVELRALIDLQGKAPAPRLVFALDGDKAGAKPIRKSMCAVPFLRAGNARPPKSPDAVGAINWTGTTCTCASG